MCRSGPANSTSTNVQWFFHKKRLGSVSEKAEDLQGARVVQRSIGAWCKNMSPWKSGQNQARRAGTGF